MTHVLGADYGRRSLWARIRSFIAGRPGRGFSLTEYNAWQWYIERNPMRGYRGMQYLGAKRIAQAASTKDDPVSAYDVMWWHDLDKLVADHRELMAKLPEEIRDATVEERQAYIAARRQREPGWLT
ncbi:hypothetical protein [Candidatus Poriferisodalis sp.]|uniref:hypothetical protein n=1 Tax=Candidatus Poriferisodalis sp. TaxID=3101277 RepID=UPI003B02A6CD